jgi:hypothetical protein
MTVIVAVLPSQVFPDILHQKNAIDYFIAWDLLCIMDHLNVDVMKQAPQVYTANLLEDSVLANLMLWGEHATSVQPELMDSGLKDANVRTTKSFYH